MHQRLRLDAFKEGLDVLGGGFGHAVVQQGRDVGQLGSGWLCGGMKRVCDSAFYAFDGVKTAVVQDVGRFA